MKNDIKFLMDLQKELKDQDTDSQAAPRFWAVGDFRMVPCPEGWQDEYHVNLPSRDVYGEINGVLSNIKQNEFEDFSAESQTEFEDIGCEISAIEWIQENYDKDAELIPVRQEHFVRENTMFLTKAEAKKHIELNHYHYSEKAHTYAMTAWRSPKVEKLLKILENFDWARLEASVGEVEL